MLRYIPASRMSPTRITGPFTGIMARCIQSFIHPTTCARHNRARRNQRIRRKGNRRRTSLTGVSDTFNPNSADKVIDGLSKLVVKELQKAAILLPGGR